MDSLTLISGTKEDDVLTGTTGTDILLGGNGEDVLSGGAGNDLLSGGNGEDVLYGGDGNDLLLAGNGNDLLDGGDGNDLLSGGNGSDSLDGGAGNDLLDGGNGNDSLDGGSGSDLILAGSGNDDANYTWSENTDSTNYYDGGRGFDTLQLTLTSAELKLAQEDIAAFNAFLNSGGYLFEFQSFDLTVRNFEALVVNIVDGNVAPVAIGNLFEAVEDVALTIAGPGVLENDFDAEHATLSAVLVMGPTNGTVKLNSDGSFTYTPKDDFFGEDSFTYMAHDGELASNVAKVTLQVAAGNDAPVAQGDQFRAAEDVQVIGNVLTNDSDIDSAKLTATLGSGPENGLLEFNSDGTFIYTPGANFSGDDFFTYQASDGADKSEIVKVSLTIDPVNDAPVAQPDDATVDEDHEVTIDALKYDTDVDAGAKLSLVSASVTGGLGTVKIVGNQLVYNPGSDYQHLKAGESAKVVIDYTIADEQGAKASSVVNVLVTGADDAPAKISVAVIGGDASTYADAAKQLDGTKFDAFAINSGKYADAGAWGAELAKYDVVVLGGSGTSPGTDYTQTSLFAALEKFVDGGGGVVTTGWFAQTLSSNIAWDSLTLGHADYITPISRAGFNYVGLNAAITVSDPKQEIVSGLPAYPYQSNAYYHELALAIDGAASGAVTLATAQAGGTAHTAIAYDEQVGLGRTAYVGGTYLANILYGTENPGGVRAGVSDQILEQAVTWAAGGSAATVLGASTTSFASAALTDTPQPEDQFYFDDVAPAQDASGSNEPLPGEDELSFAFSDESSNQGEPAAGGDLVASLETDYQPVVPASYVSPDADALI